MLCISAKLQGLRLVCGIVLCVYQPNCWGLTFSVQYIVVRISVGLARTIYMPYIANNPCGEDHIYGVYIRFWPTLYISQIAEGTFVYHMWGKDNTYIVYVCTYKLYVEMFVCILLYV